MSTRAVLRAYGLWLAGVLSAAAAAFFLYRSRVLSVELEGELEGDDYARQVDEYELEGLSERLQGYTE